LAINTGPVPVSFLSLFSNDANNSILLNIRLPMVVLAMLVGATLGIAGAAMQGLFRNPLADPGLIGVSSGAALFVALSVVVFPVSGGILGLSSMSLAAFAGAMLSALFVLRLVRNTQSQAIFFLLLAGIAISAICMAGVGFLTYLSDDNQMRTLAFWNLGSIGGALWPAALVCASITAPGFLYLLRQTKALDLLALGTEQAQYLGVDTAKLHTRVVVSAALVVGAAVAVSGIIGFVGLVVPHLIRLLIGPDHKTLLPASAIAGASLLLCADTLARTLVTPAELPVGIVTSLIGGPFFLWLILRERNASATG